MTEHEVLRDLREVGSDGPPRVRGPVRDRVSTQPEPDQGAAGKPGRRSLLWRLAAGAVVFVLGLILIWVAAGSYTPPDPAECAALRDMAEQGDDVVYEMERRGCPDVPYDAVNWP